MYGLELKNLGGDLYSLEKAVRSGKATSAFSLAQGAKVHVVSELEGKSLFIAADRLSAQEYYQKFISYLGEKSVVLIDGKDDVLLNKKAATMSQTAARAVAFTRILSGDVKVAIISAEAVLQYYPRADLFDKAITVIEKNIEIPLSELKTKLVSGGYNYVDELTERGDFILRGDIMEIYPLMGNPIRISLFDDLVEQIREFDFDSRETLEEKESVILPPASDILIENPQIVDKRLSHIKAEGHLAEIIEDIRFRLGVNPNDAALIWLLPFALENFCTIFDYLDSDWNVVFDEAKVLFDKLKLLETEHKSRIKSLTDGGEILVEHKNSQLTLSAAVKATQQYNRLAFQQLTALNPFFEAKAVFNFRSQPVQRYFLDFNSLVVDLKNYTRSGYKVYLCCRERARAKGIAENIKREEIMVYTTDTPQNGICATSFGIASGFVYHSIKLVVIGADELLGKIKQKSIFKPKKAFISPKAGDYVVHDVHGIGVCEGTERVKSNGTEKDYVVIRYRDGDRLYVPIEQMDMLERYSGGEAPKLNKLGGKDFEKIKNKVKQSVKKIAIDLLKLYNERGRTRGFKYSPDSELQRSFEDSFEFEETEDQLSAIRDIKEDMENGRLMDRLICGDVGFGKTEVAFRAIFKTIYDDKQAAILTPTTILAKQHFNTLKARLGDWGIGCEMLTRLQSNEQIKRTLNNLETGVTSIVVATHRLLSKDVKFHDLGLLVLDEEQRFGVEHKEKLKALKKDVNILTLTATPIPRTLSMSLNGLRDISLLETPPVNRLPVQTYVVEYSDNLLADAVNRELDRGGQILILYNYVDTIDSFAARVQSLIGTKGRVMVAHGQMGGAMLDERMTAFYQKEGDVLVSTTIIENGIDLPDANTLIVFDADKFGLSQLYQLRGRVGRSGNLAHAYFTTRENKVVAEPGLKRLAALMDYTELGSGFKIAMRDLEIRGAGNLLGAEQHGHIASVGYEMYTKLLREAVDEIKNNVSGKEAKTEMKVDVDAYVGDDYVSYTEKLRIYKKIADVKSEIDKKALIEYLTATYGAPNKAVKNLIDIALLKNLLADYDASRVIIGARGAAVDFASSDVIKNEDLMKRVAENHKNTVFTVKPVRLLFDTKGKTNEEVLADMLVFFGAFDN